MQRVLHGQMAQKMQKPSSNQTNPAVGGLRRFSWHWIRNKMPVYKASMCPPVSEQWKTLLRRTELTLRQKTCNKLLLLCNKVTCLSVCKTNEQRNDMLSSSNAFINPQSFKKALMLEEKNNQKLLFQHYQTDISKSACLERANVL